MRKRPPGRFLRHVYAPHFTSRGLLLRAVYVAVLFLVCHLAGLREYTSVISLTLPEGSSAGTVLFLGGLYLVAYFAFIVLTPILALAAGIFALLERFLPFLLTGTAPVRIPSPGSAATG